MKLTAKLVAGVVASVILLLALDSWLAVQRQEKAHIADETAAMQRLGHVLRDLVDRAWSQEGSAAAQALVRDFHDRHDAIDVRIVDEDTEPATAAIRFGLSDEQILALRSAEDSVELWGRFRLAAQGRPLWLELHEVLIQLQRFRAETVRRVVAVSLALAAIAALLTWWLGWRLVGRPLERLVVRMGAIGRGDFSPSTTLGLSDEFGRLEAGLNSMGAELAASRAALEQETEGRVAVLEQLRHSDRLKTVGQLVSGLAHELGTPLNVVSGRAALIESGRLAADDVRASAHVIRDQVDQIARDVRRILDFARRTQLERRPTRLRELVTRTIELVAPLAPHARARLDPASEELIADVDPGQIQQLLTNLLTNALQAMAGGGTATLGVRGTRCAESPAGVQRDWAVLSVRDEGGGIAPEHLQRLFEPFFTTKESGKGTGLGLSIVQAIAIEHGGFVEVENDPGHGACFTAYLPRSAT